MFAAGVVAPSAVEAPQKKDTGFIRAVALEVKVKGEG
jgi:hypothetical protein